MVYLDVDMISPTIDITLMEMTSALSLDALSVDLTKLDFFEEILLLVPYELCDC